MQQLNRHRLAIGRLVAAAAFSVGLFTRSPLPDSSLIHDFNDSLGILLLGVCMLGRVYCTLQIGGRKNAELVTTGIYSVVRNPLYVFSLIGVVGIGLISNQLAVMVPVIAAFFVVYLPLIRREEDYLQQTFGESFASYVKRVPRLMPDFKLYEAPDEVTVNLKTLHGAMRDALCWLLPLIIFETIESLHELGLVKPLAIVW